MAKPIGLDAAAVDHAVSPRSPSLLLGLCSESPLLGLRLRVRFASLQEGKKVAHIAIELGVGRGSVYAHLKARVKPLRA